MKFCRASEANLANINELILKSRSIWSYTEEYFKASTPAVMIDEKYLRENLCVELWNSNLVGFLAVIKEGDMHFLDHLWIAKEKLNQGLGKAAVEYIDGLAKLHGWNELLVYPDPPAEGFYLKTGFVDTGKRSPSRFQGGPVFSTFKKTYLL